MTDKCFYDDLSTSASYGGLSSFAASVILMVLLRICHSYETYNMYIGLKHVYIIHTSSWARVIVYVAHTLPCMIRGRQPRGRALYKSCTAGVQTASRPSMGLSPRI